MILGLLELGSVQRQQDPKELILFTSSMYHYLGNVTSRHYP